MDKENVGAFTEKISARGHPNVKSEHPTTLEITREDYLTPRGDCIVCICADRGPEDFSPEFKSMLKKPCARLEIRMRCGGLEEIVTAHGDINLSFENPHEMVVRKSGFTCARTLAVRADKASSDLDRSFVAKLSSGLPVEIELKVSMPCKKKE